MPQFLDNQVSKPVRRLFQSGAIGVADVSAALSIEAAVFSILTSNVRSGQREPNVPLGPREANEFVEERVRRHANGRSLFYDWVDEMSRSGLSVGPVLDVVEGKALTDIDLAWKKRKGWARRMVQNGLALYLAIESSCEARLHRLTA